MGRWILVVVTAATVLGGLMPNAIRSGAEAPISTLAKMVEEPPVMPDGCPDATCGKSVPIPSSPTLTIAAVDAMLAGVLAFALLRLVRRFRPKVRPLPRGSATSMFHPPQFSRFDLSTAV